MKKSTILSVIVIILVIVAIAWFAYGLYVWVIKTNIAYRITPTGQIEEIEDDSESENGGSGGFQNENFVSNNLGTSTVIATGLEDPVDFVFLPNREFLILEKDGGVWIAGSFSGTEEIASIPVYSRGQAGLLGLALSPDFTSDNQVYFLSTYQNQNGDLFNKITSFSLVGGEVLPPTIDGDNLPDRVSGAVRYTSLADEKIIFDKIPAGSVNNSGRIYFGPEGKLWVLTGDTGRATFSQNPDSLAGKVLRLNPDGSLPADNPWSGLAAFALGFRNPQALVWQGEKMYVADMGSNGDDEINILEAGGNFGWPVLNGCFSEDDSFINPVFCSLREAIGISGLAISPGGDLVASGIDYAGVFIPNIDIQTKREPLLENVHGSISQMKIFENSLYLLAENRGDSKLIKYELK